MRALPTLLLARLFLAVVAVETSGQQRREGNLKVGDAAEDFAIKDVEGRKTVKLSEHKGKPIVLIFGSCT